MKLNALTIVKVAGIPIRLHASWIVLALIITWSMALDFASKYPMNSVVGWSVETYWAMATIAALAVFASLILHELGHALIGRRFGVEFKEITLFIFGGVAQLKAEPRSARSEFFMAVAGPIVSGVIALGCWLTASFGTQQDWPLTVVAVLQEVAVINLVLLGFNLVPAFPLDGGRVLRALLWSTSGNLRRATAITAQLGASFGGAMVVMGIVVILLNEIMFGLWWIILGWFLQGIAQRSYEDVEIRTLLGNEPVSDFMTRDLVTVTGALSVRQLVEDFIYEHHHSLYPVVESGRLAGCVTPKEVKQLPRTEWPMRQVRDIMRTDTKDLQIAPTTLAADALAQMQSSGVTRLLVVADETVVGIITIRDLLDSLSLRLELEQHGTVGKSTVDREPYHATRC